MTGSASRRDRASSTTHHEPTLLLRAATLLDGTRADVRLVGGTIADILPPSSVTSPDTDILDLSGYLLVPSLVEPHAHLDKALTADLVPNPSGDLAGAIKAWLAARPTIPASEICTRARRVVRRLLARGTTAIRSHVDTGTDIGTRAVEALVGVRAEFAGIVDIQIAALAPRPVAGAAGAGNRAVLADALAAGADLVGGAPWIEDEPLAALDLLAQVAADAVRPLDLHVDETLDPGVLTLPDVVALAERGFPNSITASHCVSLGVQEPAVQRKIAEQVAAAGVSVVALPSTNLFLSGRGWPTSPPRGLTALGPLRVAGALVAAGGDNVRDPFNLAGRADPLEAASLLVTAGHLPVEVALELVAGGARAALGLPPVAVAAGAPADLVAVRAASVGDAIAFAPEDRVVVRGGRVVARTRITTQWPDQEGPHHDADQFDNFDHHEDREQA